MSNKSTGTAFEREFAQMLSDHGFWAHCLKDNANGQPFDVIAARNGVTYVFDCKDCQGESFKLDRIEENQHNAMVLWEETGNSQGLFAIRINDKVIIMPHKMLSALRDNGAKQVKYSDLMHYGRTFERWMELRDKLDKQVVQCW
ncbi:MAG: Holliday junction resolvase RecU [Ruminococcus sp.]|nr:Holliday junction resolvase RecU [Ruminococcus sp.]